MTDVETPGAATPLPAAFFDREVSGVAGDLVGCIVERDGPGGLVAIRLTEVEAYGGPDDPGSHARSGRTRRNASMFGPPGRAYVYFTYGMHWCLNVVCEPDGLASAVLLRAGEVVDGLELARSRRPGVRDRDLARGPARLTRALAVDGSLDGATVAEPSGGLRLRAERAPPQVLSGPRVGVAGAGAATPWRFWAAGHPTVSTYRPAAVRARTGR